MKTLRWASIFAAAVVVHGQVAPSTGVQDTVILRAPVTVAPPSPTGSETGESIYDSISVETTDSKDLIFHYSPSLQAKLSRAIDSCKNRTEDACFYLVQTSILASSPQLQKRVIGAVVVGAFAVVAQLLTAYTLLQSGSGRGYAKVPQSIRISSSDISAVQSAVSATKPVAIAPQTSAIPVPEVINQGIIVDTTTNPDYLTFLINDGAIYEYFYNSVSNETCAVNAKHRRRATEDCKITGAVQALKYFATSKSHAFESLRAMPRLPSVKNPDLQRDLSKFIELSSGIEGFASLGADVMMNVALGLVLMNGGVDNMINNVIRIAMTTFDNTAIQRSKAQPSSVGLPSLHFILPRTGMNADQVDASLSAVLSPTSLRRNRFASARWDYWDTIISDEQARDIQVTSNDNIKVVPDDAIEKEGFLTTNAPSVAPNPTAIHSRIGRIPVLEQGYSPRDEYEDLIDYSVSPEWVAQGTSGNRREDNNYTYPDLADIDTWVYLIEEGVDTSHGDFGSKVWKEPPLVHPDLRWQQGGDYGNVGNGRGTCIASKVAGTRFGAAKNASIILVAVPPRISSMWWAFGAIHQDIEKRQRAGTATPRKTVVISALTWDEQLVYKSFLRKITGDRRVETAESFMWPKEQIDIITQRFSVPVIQGMKGWVKNRPYIAPDEQELRDLGLWESLGPEYKTVPARWAYVYNLQLINVVGSTENFGWDVDTQEADGGLRVDQDRDADESYYSARSAKVVCALPQNQRTMIRYGSSGLAAAAAGGTLLNALIHLPASTYWLPSQTGPSLDVPKLIKDFSNGRLESFDPPRISPDVNPVGLWTHQRIRDGPLLAWNRYDGRGDACAPGNLVRRQIGDFTDQCAPNRTGAAPELSTSGASRRSTLSTSITATYESEATSKKSVVTSAPTLPSMSTWSIECDASRSGQTRIAKDYASTGIANFCTSNSRSTGPKTLDLTNFNADYRVQRKDNSCNGQPPFKLGLGLLPNEAESQSYHGWPADICSGIMSRVVEKCEWGGVQRVGFIEGSLGSVAICPA